MTPPADLPGGRASDEPASGAGSGAPDSSSDAFAPAAMAGPVAWLGRLADEDLVAWLRRAAWTRQLGPFVAPPSSDAASFLVSHLRDAPPSLVTRLRALLPLLFREWGSRDPERALDDLLVIAAGVRAAAAEPELLAIVRERLGAGAGAHDLRWRCLSVLSGFGVTARSLPLFRAYLDEPRFTALCFRALYRYDLARAVTELPSVMDVMAEEPDKMRTVLQLLFFERRPSEVVELLGRLIRERPEERLLPALRLLAGVGVQLNVYETAAGREILRVTRAIGRDPGRAWSWEVLGTLETSQVTDERVPLILDALASDGAPLLEMLGQA